VKTELHIQLFSAQKSQPISVFDCYQNLDIFTGWGGGDQNVMLKQSQLSQVVREKRTFQIPYQPTRLFQLVTADDELSARQIIC
jgi:hypothetical protein